jgi:hypothetical protein
MEKHPLNRNKMTRKQTTKTDEATATPSGEDEKVEVSSDAQAPEVADPKAPVSLETQSSEEPVAAPPAAEPVKVQNDFREKLARKTDNQDVFVPSNPATLEKAAAEVAQENGFELNRGTSVGARLLARAQKRV